MKIAVAQAMSTPADIAGNIQRHLKLVEQAIAQGVRVIIFPELSLSGYEPTMAASLATTPQDSRFKVFQQLSEQGQITIGVGMPAKSEEGIRISLLLFQPHQPLLTYFKKYLHPDEEPFFIPGSNLPAIRVGNLDIALAVCYEISVEEHTKFAITSSSGLYIASVAKALGGVNKAHQRLSEIAATYGVTVLMANCTGMADGEECAGRSAIWNKEGKMLDQIDKPSEGILIWDTHTHQASKEVLR